MLQNRREKVDELFTVVSRLKRLARPRCPQVERVWVAVQTRRNEIKSLVDAHPALAMQPLRYELARFTILLAILEMAVPVVNLLLRRPRRSSLWVAVEVHVLAVDLDYYFVEPTRNARKGTELLRVCTLIVTAVTPRARHLSSRPSLLLEKKVIQESDGKPKQLSAVGRSRGEFSGVTDFLKEE